MSKKYNFIDLFAGCGGFSEGFYMENFKSLLHLEIDKNACETLNERMRYYKYEDSEVEKAVLCEDITNEMLNYIGRHIPNNEYKFICEIDDNNGNTGAARLKGSDPLIRQESDSGSLCIPSCRSGCEVVLACKSRADLLCDFVAPVHLLRHGSTWWSLACINGR